MILTTIFNVEFKIMLNISDTVVVRFKIIIVIWIPKANVNTVSHQYRDDAFDISTCISLNSITLL